MLWLSVLAFGVSWVVGCTILLWSRHHLKNVYGQDMPQRIHAGQVPRLGGIAILLGVVVAWLLAAASSIYGGDKASLRLNASVVWWCLALLPAVAGGIMDDLTQQVGVRYRLLLSLISACLAVSMLDMAVPALGVVWVDDWLQQWPWLGMGVALLAITGLPHAFNIIDGCNGLAGVVAMIICLALAFVALQVGDRSLAVMMLLVAAATLGFLCWNYPSGMLFAGDGGAYLWGVAIAFGSIALVQRHPQVSPWFPMLLLIYPVWETVFSMYRKWARGGSPGVADALHLHQLIYRRIVWGVFDDDGSRKMLMRNNRTSPYLWGFTLLTVLPAVLFWHTTWVLVLCCIVFAILYVAMYLAIVRFKVPGWVQQD